MWDFSDDGFNNIIVKEEDEVIEIRTNAVTKEQALDWRTSYCRKFNCSFNVLKTYNVSNYFNVVCVRVKVGYSTLAVPLYSMLFHEE